MRAIIIFFEKDKSPIYPKIAPILKRFWASRNKWDELDEALLIFLLSQDSGISRVLPPLK